MKNTCIVVNKVIFTRQKLFLIFRKSFMYVYLFLKYTVRILITIVLMIPIHKNSDQRTLDQNSSCNMPSEPTQSGLRATLV